MNLFNDSDRHPMRCSLFALFFFCVTAMSAQQDPDLDTLATYMSGSFSSQKQSLRDTSYLDVRLHMCRIWETRTDGVWIYVEQAMATTPDAPYRQRVYRLHRNEDRVLESAVYALPNPSAVVGACVDTAKLGTLTPEQLKLRDGCQVYLRESNGHFEGATEGMACGSELKGAAFASTEVKIYANAIISWDRGFSASGEQVWGATKGGYIFLRTP